MQTRLIASLLILDSDVVQEGPRGSRLAGRARCADRLIRISLRRRVMRRRLGGTPRSEVPGARGYPARDETEKCANRVGGRIVTNRLFDDDHKININVIALLQRIKWNFLLLRFQYLITVP